MKLYGSYTSPYVRHVRIVLQETQQPYEFIETDHAGSSAKSPTKRVPFLEDGDLFLTDSTSIIQHLRTKAGQDFCRSARELDQFCMVNTALDTTLNLFLLKRDGVAVTELPYLQRQLARVQTILKELEQSGITTAPSDGPYTDAQLRLACFMGWSLFREQLDFSGYGNLEGFYRQIGQYAPFAATHPPSS